MNIRHFGTASLLIAMPLALSGCGSSGDDTDAAASSPAAMSSSADASSMPADTSSQDSMTSAATSTAAAADAPFGSGCAAVPKSGKGSFSGMAADPVATAASNNPALSTLVTAVKAAGLVDTLNNADNITVFAPTNDAFAKIPKADLDKLLKDKDALTKVLTGHVVTPKLAPNALAGEHDSLAKTKVKVTGSGEDFTVDGSSKVVCGNVQTSNATVYIIDTVLMPAS
ncbi:fasciclin domain-containing protein [Dermacoccaceae bacterium W4C1]